MSKQPCIYYKLTLDNKILFEIGVLKKGFLISSLHTSVIIYVLYIY